MRAIELEVEQQAWVRKNGCQFPEVCAQVHRLTQVHMCFCQVKETRNVIQSVCYASAEQTHYALGAAFSTNRHQNKQASQLAYICSSALTSTCKLLSDGLVPSNFLFYTWPQNSSHLVCVSPIIDMWNTLVCLPEALGAFQCRVFFKLFGFAHCDSECLSIYFLCLFWWSVVGFSLKTQCSSPELEVILLKHLVMTQVAYQTHITCDSLSWGWPLLGKLDFVYFQTVPYIYIGPGCDDTSGWWKWFQCLCPSSKGLMGTSTGDVIQEEPWANPHHSHLLPWAPDTLNPPSSQQGRGQLTN